MATGVGQRRALGAGTVVGDDWLPLSESRLRGRDVALVAFSQVGKPQQVEHPVG